MDASTHRETSESVSSRIITQFLRYCIVGGLAFVIDYGTLMLLHKVFGVHYRIAAGSGFLLGLLVNYAISVVWVFDSRTYKNPYFEFGLFAAIGLLGLVINDQVIYVCTEYLGLDPGISKLPAAAIVLFVNFGLRKFLLFQPQVELPSQCPTNKRSSSAPDQPV